MDRFGPDNFSTLQIKGHVLHCERAHLKVPAWLLVWNALLTKKLPMFLSRLNEISGGCEKSLPVSGSFWSNLKFFRMMDLTEWWIYLVILPPTQHHSFFRNLPPLYVLNLPFLTSHLSPVQGCLQEQEKVLFSLSCKQEPPLIQLVIKHPYKKLTMSVRWKNRSKN